MALPFERKEFKKRRRSCRGGKTEACACWEGYWLELPLPLWGPRKWTWPIQKKWCFCCTYQDNLINSLHPMRGGCVFMTMCVWVCVRHVHMGTWTLVGVFEGGPARTRPHELALRWSFCDAWLLELWGLSFTRAQQAKKYTPMHISHHKLHHDSTVYSSPHLFVWYFLPLEHGWILVQSLLHLELRVHKFTGEA